MKILGLISLLVLALAVVVVLAGQLDFLSGSTPSDLGVQDGRLKPPATTPNSVSSQADLYPDHPQRSFANIAPLVYQGDADVAMKKLASVLQHMPHTKPITVQADYLYAECSTPLLKFTDDVEFWLDRKANVIHVRSASRLGRSDLGANRARVETIRAQFQQN
jgi:uncharacterized protein (DUF1499 family)